MPTIHIIMCIISMNANNKLQTMLLKQHMEMQHNYLGSIVKDPQTQTHFCAYKIDCHVWYKYISWQKLQH